MGIWPAMFEKMLEADRTIDENGAVTLRAERNAIMALSFADIGDEMKSGKIIFFGAAAERLKDERGQRAYPRSRAPYRASKTGRFSEPEPQTKIMSAY